MNAWMWAIFAVVAVVYGAVSITRNWLRERALTAQCRADEQAKTEALRRQTTGGHDRTTEAERRNLTPAEAQAAWEARQ